MESLLLDIITNYGVDGFMAAALVYIVIRFDRRIEQMSNDAMIQRKALIELVENNTRAMTGLKIIVENFKTRD